MKIAIVKISSLGDIVHTMVVLQFIKKKYPLSEIDWIVEKRFKGVLELNPHISNIKFVNLHEAKRSKSLILLFKELAKVKSFGNYDLVIDFQGLIKTAIISKFLNAKEIVGFDWESVREGIASLFYSRKVKIGYDQNTILRYAMLASEALKMKISIDDLFSKEAFLFSSSKQNIPTSSYIVFIIGSSWESRNYPKEKFVQVANKLKKDCLVVWGDNNERQKAEWMSYKSSFIKVMPKLSLDDLKFVISNACLVIGNDTGPSHMSWASNVPSIILFGPTPVERMFLTDLNRELHSNSEVNHMRLNKKDFSIKEINVNEIVKVAQNLLRLNS